MTCAELLEIVDREPEDCTSSEIEAVYKHTSSCRTCRHLIKHRGVEASRRMTREEIRQEDARALRVVERLVAQLGYDEEL